MEVNKCVIYMEDGSRYVFDYCPNATIAKFFDRGGEAITYTANIESHHIEYYPKRTSKRYKKNRRGYR